MSGFKHNGITYYDSGCTAAPACLQCPLPYCREEDQEWRYNTIRELKARGSSNQQIVESMQVSIRTVFRALDSLTVDT